MNLPYVKVVRPEIEGVQLGVIFSFRAAPELATRALEAALKIFVSPHFQSVHIRDEELWADYGQANLDNRLVDALIYQIAQEVGFTLAEPVPLYLARSYLEESMCPHLPGR